MLEFKEEMLIPKINGQIYYWIYEIENWLRRICLTIYQTQYGVNWANELPISTSTQEKNDYMAMSFGVTSSDNVIWLTTLSQINILLMKQDLSDRVELFTGFKPLSLKEKIDDLRGIRNFLAHNQAFSKKTETICKGVIEYLRTAIDTFKTRVFYDKTQTIMDINDRIVLSFENKMKDVDFKKFQYFIESNDNIYGVVCLPLGDRCFVSGLKLIESYKPMIDYILAFLVNKECEEYSVLISKQIDPQVIDNIIDIFKKSRSFITGKKYEDQNPTFICHPKIWFYENRQIRVE